MRNSHEDGVTSFKFPMDQRLSRELNRQIERTRAIWTSRSEHLCICGPNTSQDCLQEMSSVLKNVGMKI